MKINHSSKLLLCVGLIAGSLLSNSRSAAQEKPQTQPNGENPLAHLTEFEQKLDPSFISHLSTGGATMFHLAKVLSNPATRHALASPRARQIMDNALARLHSLPPKHSNEIQVDGRALGPVPVNDADLDYIFTRFGGFTQSETASAWCGNNIVVGFNDSGALLRTIVERSGGNSFTSVGVSQNHGQTFTGLPFLNPGPDRGTFLGGDPVVVCSDSRHFIYASLLSHVVFDSKGNVVQATSGISISHSTSGGLFWESPLTTVSKDANFHFLDKEWMAIDPRNAQNLYITYTDFGAFASDKTCNDHIDPGAGNGGPDVRLEIIASKDGGNSWSAPVLIDRHCNLQLGQNLSGSQVVVGPAGQVYVAYASIDQKNSEMRIRKSLDGGVTFAPTVVVAEATAASSLSFDHLEGNFRTNAFPTLAIDTFNDAHRGSLYMTWTDARRNQIHDTTSNVFFGDPVYSFGDIVLSVSHDGGTTWSKPALISPAPASFKGSGRDQFTSAVAIDKQGSLAVCYSDRRNDPNNLAIDHFCSLSNDQGRTFHDVRETPASWSPSHATDFFVNPAYMGDYDTVSVDSTGVHAGFFNTFQIQTNTNPDVFGMLVKP